MSGRSRHVQLAGLLLLTVSAFLPAFAWHVAPPASDAGVARGALIVYIDDAGPVRRPALDLAQGAADWWGGATAQDALWSRRPIYAYALLVVWAGALLLARRWRRTAGALLWVVAIAVAAFEAAYLRSDYLPFFPVALGSLEQGLAWCVVLALLAWRRKPDRHLGAVEAGIAAQALLGFVHGITLPCTLVRDQLGSAPVADLAGRIGDAFGVGFWLGMLGLLLACLPVYVGRRRAPDVTGSAGATA